jgi:nickel/cobalt exporter
MKRAMTLAAKAAFLGLVMALLFQPAAAPAHPLGNFTVSQYAGLTVTPQMVEVDYVLDMAELPTIAERAGIQESGQAKTCTDIGAASELKVEGKPVPLRGSDATLTYPAGAAGLSTLRLECRYSANVAVARPIGVSFKFGAYTDRLGVREITVTGDQTSITGDHITAGSRTQRLTTYPSDLLAEPLDTRQVSFTASPGGRAATPPHHHSSTAPTSSGLQAALAGLAGKQNLTAAAALIGVLMAILLGAGHAAAPGHGKTIMAAYLIGQKGRRRQALGIAATVTATHTAGVLVLGVAITASFTFAPQALYRWLAIANGILVAIIGAILLRRALATRHDSHGLFGDHHHDHHHHDDGEHHHREHDHHTHDHHGATSTLVLARHVSGQADSSPDRRRTAEWLPGTKTVLAMGFAGGLTPSPSAVVVLLGAAAVGRAWFGVVLVVAYGAGMAAALTGAGMVLAKFSDRLQGLLARRWAPTLGKLPIISSALVLGAGITITALAALSPGRFL